MPEINSEHQNADILRKNHQYKDAIDAYQKLWDETEDKWDGWGLALCLNKEKQRRS